MSIGQQFGRLTVIAELPRSRKAGTYTRWLCKCECGTIKAISKYSVSKGATKSCGCWNKASATMRATTHGQGKRGEYSKAYRSWRAMRDRCERPTNNNWKWYGGKGISIAPELHRFEGFFAILGDCPEGMSLDRIDPAGNYTPDNIRWLPIRLQGRNRGITKKYTFNGQTKSIPDWADEIGIDARTLNERIRRGFTIEETLTLRLHQRPKRKIVK